MSATPTTVLPQQLRNGTDDSASVAVPAQGTINPATGQPYQFVIFTLPLSNSDALNPANFGVHYAKASWDGINYQVFNTYPWQGPVLDKQGNPSSPSAALSMPTDANGNWPQRVMGTHDTEGNSYNIGLTIGFQ